MNFKKTKNWIWAKISENKSDEKDFDNEYEARELERNLKSSMKNKKDYFEPARVEVKMVQRIGNENSSYIYYK